VIKRIKNSLAFRLSGLYKSVLKYFVSTPGKKTTAFTNEYDLVILCGAQQVDMLRLCLKSIYNRFEKLPHVFVFTDLNVNMDECKKAVKWFPAENLNIIRGIDCLNYHFNHKKESLIAFAKNNPMGIKLAAIMQMLNAGKPIIYCDTDVLWYNDPLPVIKEYLKDEDFEMAMSEDFQPAYDQNLVKKANLDALNKAPYFCAGILMIKKLSEQNQKTLTSLLKIVEQESNHFSEQTIFAFLNKKGNNLALDNTKFIIKTTDQFDLQSHPIPGVIARHYIGPVRHLFWRDALWIK
jgi:hypothetical protein